MEEGDGGGVKEAAKLLSKFRAGALHTRLLSHAAGPLVLFSRFATNYPAISTLSRLVPDGSPLAKTGHHV
jgi:hypothetical protein